MKVDIRDREALCALRPSNVVAYLLSRGWQEHRRSASTWTRFVLDDEFEIDLPLTTDLGDYSLRMAEALQTLELAENRDQLQIMADLSLPALPPPHEYASSAS